MKRRTFLKMTGATAGVAVLGGGAMSLLPSQRAYGQSIGEGLARFVDPLPIPSVITSSGTSQGDPLYTVTIRQFRQKLHRDLPATTLWGFNSMYPGPTFDVRRGRPIAVRWRNDLTPTAHPLPVDHTLHGAETTPQVRTVVHLHGHKVLPESDGYPEAWFTRGFAQKGPFWENEIYRYPNDQPATTLWYHDHSLGVTRLNMTMGLSGFYLLRDAVEDDLNLPRGAQEIPLVIQDRAFDADGSLLYPVQEPGDPEIPPVWVPEFFGDTILVNGKVWPFLEVEPRKYRFRILNASNARFYHLTLNRRTGGGHSSPPIYLIGTDGGLIPAPVRLADITIGPAERFDVVIDFSDFAGDSFVLNNDAKAPFPDGDDVIPTDVMLFKVTRRSSGRDTSELPRSLAPVPLLNTRDARTTRDLVLIELASAQDNPIVGLINERWDRPVTEDPRAGSIEIWRLINTTGDAHPIHIHLVQFQILDRQPFDPDQYPARLVFTGPRVAPPPEERPAFKDTVKAFPGEVTRVIAKFDLPSGTRASRGDRFRYVFHCHILEHEDNDMMRPYDVVG